MAEQSHRDEMNAAIRAQRERHAAPRTIAPADDAPAVAPEAVAAAPELLDLPELPGDAEPLDVPEPLADAEPKENTVQEPARAENAAPSRRSLFDRLRGR